MTSSQFALTTYTKNSWLFLQSWLGVAPLKTLNLTKFAFSFQRECLMETQPLRCQRLILISFPNSAGLYKKIGRDWATQFWKELFKTWFLESLPNFFTDAIARCPIHRRLLTRAVWFPQEDGWAAGQEYALSYFQPHLFTVSILHNFCWAHGLRSLCSINATPDLQQPDGWSTRNL